MKTNAGVETNGIVTEAIDTRIGQALVDFYGAVATRVAIIADARVREESINALFSLSARTGAAFIELGFTHSSSVAVYTVTRVRHDAVHTAAVDARRGSAFINVNTAACTSEACVTVARIEVYVINAFAIDTGV